MNHHKGLYRLLEKRGPSRYQSDFERQLLMAAIGMIVSVAFAGRLTVQHGINPGSEVHH